MSRCAARRRQVIARSPCAEARQREHGRVQSSLQLLFCPFLNQNQTKTDRSVAANAISYPDCFCNVDGFELRRGGTDTPAAVAAITVERSSAAARLSELGVWSWPKWAALRGGTS
uniref:Uncharacterized protein n=1 Tax=Arundo donax TaxID=35708 RepID=A0A0A9F1X8_ARUDO